MNSAYSALLCIVSASCGGIVVLDLPKDDGDGEMVGGSSSTGAGGMELDASSEGGPEAGGDADVPETCESTVPGVFKCCDGSPCRGFCDPNWGCVCGSVLGGCQSPTICCLNTGACTSVQACP